MPTPCSTARIMAPRLLTEICGDARILRIAPDGQQRIEIVEKMRRGRRAEGDEMMVVEILDRARLAGVS